MPRGGKRPSSAKQRAIASALCRELNAKRATAERCGARKRGTDERCQNVPMRNGRCRLHGGATPKGDQWHKPQLPKPDAPNVVKRLRRKLWTLEKRARERRARREAMTPEQRAAHDEWHRTHQAGPQGARRTHTAVTNQDREARALLAEIRAANERRASEREGDEIDALLRELRAQAAALERRDVFE